MTAKNQILLLTFLLAGILGGCTKQASKIDASELPTIKPKNDLPKMVITTMDDSKINTHELTGNTMIILFQPDCSHCQQETREIRAHLGDFKNYSLYFITADQKPAVEKFAKDFDLLGHANVHFAFTSTEEVLKNFGQIPAPSIYIYSQQHLIKQFNGEADIEEILLAI